MVDVTKVTGRQELIAKVEDINAGLHQLHILVANLEGDLERAMAQRNALQEERDALLRQSISVPTDPPRVAILEQVVASVWRDGMSIYDPVIQRLIEKLGMNP